jgi:hypothetical protein
MKKHLTIITLAVLLAVLLTYTVFGDNKVEFHGQSLGAPPATGTADIVSGRQVVTETNDTRDVVWDNGGWLTWYRMSMYHSSWNSIIADDFQFSEDTDINGVNWYGVYYYPPEDDNFDYEIIFYEDFGDGTKPGAVYATYYMNNADINETLVQSEPNELYFSYAASLPSAITFNANTKYWVSFQGYGSYPPATAITYSASQQLHVYVWKSAYYGYPDWTASNDIDGNYLDFSFQLTYTQDQEVGACCFADGSCLDYTESECLAEGGVWHGPETACLGDTEYPFDIDDACHCLFLPGDAYNSDTYNILDITHLIDFLYQGGPGPFPYDTLSGDANCDCYVNIIDITYLIEYIYLSGPYPCSCFEWTTICGWPLRK